MLKRALKAALFVVLVALLTGCDQSQAIDDLRNKLASADSKISDLKKEIGNSRQQNSDLQAQISALDGRLSSLEAARKEAHTDGPATLSSEQANLLEGAIAKCVQTVRSLRGGALTDALGNNVYSKFDAFYNPASGRVQNNNQFVDQAAVFAFNKCMTEKGWPLK